MLQAYTNDMPRASSTKVEWSKICRQLLTISGPNQHPLPYQVEVRPNAEFNYEGAKHKLLNINVGQIDPTATFWVPGESVDAAEAAILDMGMHCRQGKLLQMSAWVNTDNKASMGCVGAVLAYIQRKCASEYLPSDEAVHQAYPVYRLETFTLHGTLYGSSGTLGYTDLSQVDQHGHYECSSNHPA